MEKLRKDIEDIYKWNLTDLIKDDEEYQELVTKSYMLIGKIIAMKDDLLKNSNNFLMYLKTDEELDKTVEKVYVYSYLYFYQDMNDAKGKIYKDSADKLMEEMNGGGHFSAAALSRENASVEEIETELIETIQKSKQEEEENEKILLLLQDFLAMNKIKVQKEILDINMLLEDVVDQLTPLLKEKNINFAYDISLDEVFVEGDYNRLNQVLINMIKNSVEALDATENPKISLNYEIKDNHFIIIIEDNGCGIKAEDMERIKEPFYTTKKNGTGLGVSLSLEIISAHDGTLEYLSQENIGTKVIITLPIYEILD